MNPFLQQVARYYVGDKGLEDYCFVFPNRRSGQFFTHYLQQCLIGADQKAGIIQPHLMPCVTSINDLVAKLTGSAAATDVEMMFALYDAYCQVMGDRAQEFDRFIYWAQLIISDFNDIDRSLADAHDIYQNLDDLHSLSSNYLSPEVQDKVKKIFGESLFTAFFDTSADASLWQHSANPSGGVSGATDDSVKREFINLWNALESIYHLYHDVLATKRVVSPGRQLRMAAEQDDRSLEDYKRLVFVGFGVLSAAEVKLFDHYKREGLADFWWDNAGLKDMLSKAPHDPGALLIDGYCKRFESKPLEPIDDADGPEIRAVAVASTVGQAKQAFNEVTRMAGGARTYGIETAIVLPDENLLVPLLHSVHGVNDLNVTLGYPLRSSGIVSLMHIVARMHHQASRERGVWTYYREDINGILSHPLIKTYFTQEALDLACRLETTNRFRVPSSEFRMLSFRSLFEPAVNSDAGIPMSDQHVNYLDNLLDFCDILISRMSQGNASELDDDDNSDLELPLQQAFLMMYIDVLNQLKSALSETRQSLQYSTVFFLIDRLTSSAIVPFTGQPLKGLQVMGLLETRSLDFENVVILSMNERVFPRKRSINSFIPNYIRRAHGMSTTEQQEAIVAFNFYRLLNRARRVTLIYDSSAQKMGSAEPSRYIAQLEKIYAKQVQHVEMTPGVNTTSSLTISVPNNQADLDLKSIYNAQEGGKYLSASAINKYINCPLMFYMHHVRGLSNDNEAQDFMDNSTFGVIVHNTLRDCYDNPFTRARNGLIDRPYIESFIQKKLTDAVVRNIKKDYLHVPEDKLDDASDHLRGEPLMLVETIKSFVRFVLDHDLELIDKTGPFTIIECEQTHMLPSMPMGNISFNFVYLPDRIDRLADGTLRIVDYKTGKEPTTFSSLNDLFDPNKSARLKGVLQSILYCYAYLLEHPDEKQACPVIYCMPSMKDAGAWHKSPSKPPVVQQYVFSMEDPIAQEFINRMVSVISGIFRDDFSQAREGSETCNYCRFLDFCRRTQVKKYDF